MAVSRLCLPLLLLPAATRTFLHTANAATDAAVASCNITLAKDIGKDFLGHCPCECQLAKRQQFPCEVCPATCRRYAELCSPSAVCTDRPPAIDGVQWADCKSVAASVNCYGECKSGFTGVGATTKCTALGWEAPISHCVGQQGAAAGKQQQPQPAATLQQQQQPSSEQKQATVTQQQQQQQQQQGHQGVQQTAASFQQHQRQQQQQAPQITVSAAAGAAAASTGSSTGSTTGKSSTATASTTAPASPAAAAAAQQLPVAVSTCTGSPAAVSRAKWPESCLGAKAGDACTAACLDWSMVGGFRSLCGSGGAWGPPEGGCNEVQCLGRPKAVDGAIWPDCTGYMPGDQCVARGCSEGYVGQGYIANCMLDGSWGDIWGDCRQPGAVISTPSGGNHL